MSETFSQSHIGADQQVEEGVLHSLEDCPDGYRLWFAKRLTWPLQFIRFEAVVATPRKLSSLEKILLYIYQAMQDAPPDRATIARKLGIKDSFFVNETIRELRMLAALQIDSEGKINITDLGCECHSRGQLPSESSQKQLSLLFDPIAHEFPGKILVLDGEQSDSKDTTLEPIDPNFKLADANRIDIETIQRIAKAQGLVSSEDAVIFDAKPVEIEKADGQIFNRQIDLQVFSNNKKEVKLNVSDPKSSSVTEWFQQILDARLEEGRIDLAYLQTLSQETIPQNDSKEVAESADKALQTNEMINP